MGSVIDITLEQNQLTQQLVDCFLKVHSKMGPGLLESIYRECLCHEFKKRGISFEKEKAVPLFYDGELLLKSLRLDLIVENQIIIELKSIQTLVPVHDAQIISYLKLTGLKIGFLVKFNISLIKQGIKRFAL